MQAQAEHRSQVRSNVFLSAALVADGAAQPVRVRNLSPTGALLEGSSLPPAGAAVRLLRGELLADGEIAWADAGHAGIRFTGQIDVSAWVKRIGHAGQQRVDSALAALRRREAPHLAAVAAPLPSLAWISAELEAICERMAASSDLMVEFGEELVRLDSLSRAILQHSRGAPRR